MPLIEPVGEQTLSRFYRAVTSLVRPGRSARAPAGTEVVEIDGGSLTTYAGDYVFYEQQRAMNERQQQALAAFLRQAFTAKLFQQEGGSGTADQETYGSAYGNPYGGYDGYGYYGGGFVGYGYGGAYYRPYTYHGVPYYGHMPPPWGCYYSTVPVGAILGALQGVTELFPISSLGHSVILPSLLGWDIQQDQPYFLSFLVATHLATALVLGHGRVAAMSELALTTTPAGATVEIDGRQVGKVRQRWHVERRVCVRRPGHLGAQEFVRRLPVDRLPVLRLQCARRNRGADAVVADRAH